MKKSKFWKFVNAHPSEDSFWHRLGAGSAGFSLCYIFMLHGALPGFSFSYYARNVLTAVMTFSPIVPLFAFIIAISADQMFLEVFPLSKDKKYTKKYLMLRGAFGCMVNIVMLLVMWWLFIVLGIL